MLLRHLRTNGRVESSSLDGLIVLALNLVMGFIVPGISWQAHIGGLVVGALVAWVMVATRQSHQRAQQVGLLVAVAGALVALTALRLFA